MRRLNVQYNAPARLQGGFTLVELVSVLIIMGILAAVAMPRFFQKQTFDVRAFADQAQSVMRYAQKLAIAQNRDVHVRLNGNSIAFCFTAFAPDGTCASEVPAPLNLNSGSADTRARCGNSTTWLCEAIPGDITYTIVPSVPGFLFNALGKPFNLADTPPDSSFATITMSFSGGGLSQNIVVERETGYVHP
ncbi:pilus assembly FimT family protein [Noviherbaspirillum sp.]|uniref:pilus assembly FimT family protein n=1 Tax=Noviherbaspirillum sp. TaxID=1926288 RepID=UPI002FE2394D